MIIQHICLVEIFNPSQIYNFIQILIAHLSLNSKQNLIDSKATHELKATKESMGRDKNLLMKCFVFV